MVYEKRLKLFQSLVTIAGFTMFVSMAYRLWGGDNFGERTPDIILFSGYLSLAVCAFVLILISFPFLEFVKEVYLLTVVGVESPVVTNLFRFSNYCFAIYCSIQASSIIGSVFHVSWTSMPFSVVLLTFFIFAPFYISLASILSLLTFHKRQDSEAVIKAFIPSNGMHNCAPFALISLLSVLSHCWITTFNSFGKELLESFAYNYDFQTHSCTNVSERNVVYLSSSHAKVLVRKVNQEKIEYFIFTCIVRR